MQRKVSQNNKEIQTDGSEEYNSNKYNDSDSFIADDDEFSDTDSDDQEKRKLKVKKVNTSLKKKKWGKLTQEEVENAQETITGGKKKRRLKKIKDQKKTTIQDLQKDPDDDFLDDEEEEEVPRRSNMVAKRMAPSVNFELDQENTFNQHELGKNLTQHHDLLKDIFNDKNFAEDLVEQKVEADKLEDKDDFSKMLAPEDQQRHFLTEKDQEINRIDIPERLQIRFEERAESSSEDIVHEARWIVKKLLKKKHLIDKYCAKLEVKVYGVLENLLWKNQEIMYIWMYSRQEITSNTNGANNMDTNEELSLEDLWFIYFSHEEWQRCSELRLSLNNMIELLEKYSSLDKYALMAVQSAEDLNSLSSCYEYLKFRLKVFLDEQNIETFLEGKKSNVTGNSRNVYAFKGSKESQLI